MSSTQRPILFVSLPEAGLLNPLLVLVEELSRRGVPDLWFAADEKARAGVEAAQVGSPIQFFSLGEVTPEMSSVTWDDETYRRVTQRSRFKAHRAVIEQTHRPEQRVPKYRALEEAVDKAQPALMVIDCMCRFAHELAMTEKIPYVLSDTFVPSYLLTSPVPIGKSYTPADFPAPNSGLPLQMNVRQRLANRLFKWRTLSLAFSSMMKERNARDTQVRAELEIDPASFGQFTRIEAAELVLCYAVPEMDYPFEIPEVLHTVGAVVPPLPQAPGEELTRWLDERESVIYAGFGTITRLTAKQVRSFVEVVRRLDGRHDVLWKLPQDQQKWLPDDLPGNLRIEEWVPSQVDVLAHPHVKVFFTHGGGNAYTEGVHFGKPMVMRPLWVDCYDQAVRSQDVGVSLTLDKPHDMDPDDVLDKLTRVLDGASFRERAEHLAELQRAAGGRTTAVDLILGLPALTVD
ncbi:glycosyltransferase [Saccharopolyspora dendranthemae]|uniref:Polyene glycosyltransferase n=1 Tax=Saccharopolyspora dendranthemae TaxID=1181886 RepID=A0A561U3E3_9PSEU|nr:glycosyltransferase [Saccharopolyspora dendranthemae]TWF93867.1 polyene glycosyltransferase [Saccharopolyspora dendranthemae]